ncbi:hypothetical protein PAEN110709_30290 [Paenibacillus endophyticus]
MYLVNLETNSLDIKIFRPITKRKQVASWLPVFLLSYKEQIITMKIQSSLYGLTGCNPLQFVTEGGMRHHVSTIIQISLAVCHDFTGGFAFVSI